MAYGHFVARGYVDGHDVDDWLEAQAEVERASGDDAQGQTAVAH